VAAPPPDADPAQDDPDMRAAQTVTANEDAATENETTARGARLVRRLLGNYLFQTMNLGVRLVENLLLVPLYIYAWGPILYKDWIILFALASFLSWCTLGIDEYFGNLFLRDVSLGDFATLRRRVRLSLFVATCVTLVICVPLYAVLAFGDFRSMLRLSVMDDATALHCLVAMTLPLWVWFGAAVLRGCYRAYGDFSRGECIFAIYNASQIGAAAVALALKVPPQGLAFVFMTGPILYAVGMTIDIRRRYPEVTLGFAIPTAREWREIVPQSLYYFTSPLATALNMNGILLFFGAMGIGALETVQFNVLRVFTGITRQLGANSFAIGSGIEMARQMNQGDRAACQRLYAATGRIVSIIGGVLAGVSLPLSGPFVTLWTHGTVAADRPLILSFLIGIMLAAPGRASLMLLRYTNNANAVAWSSAAYAFGGLALMVPLASHWGGFGVALAFAITETAAIGLYPPIVVSRTFHFGAARHLGESYLAGALAFAVSYGAAAALFAGMAPHPLSILLRLLAWAACALPSSVFLVLSREQRRRLAAPLLARS
jgi:O-antigen/teichoic acid export membrane protein